jgi:membrane associated rhomboid family serine protease
MIAASVGFQCPECVKEGARTQRPLRTTYGGLRPTAPGSVSIALIALNLAVWLAVTISGRGTGRLVSLLELRPRGVCAIGNSGYDLPRSVCAANGGTWYPGVSDGAYWQLLTSAFTHVEVLHVAFNMFALWVLGPQLEHAFGRARFVALYLISALAGSALVYAASPEYGATLGASGAIFGLMGALLVIAVRTRTSVQSILVWIGINAVLTLSVANISWQGHLGGFVGGLLVAAAIVWAPRTRRALVQWGGMAAVSAALVGAVVVRTLMLA